MNPIEILSSPPTLTSLEDLKSPKNIEKPNLLSLTTQPSTPKNISYAQNGDLFDLIITRKIKLDDTTIRTYFIQILDSLEILHSQGMACGDLKLENLWLDEKFAVKICDFDMGFLLEEQKIASKDTVDYRAPEVKEGSCSDQRAADIFSLGMILFMLKTGGNLPVYETETHDTKEFVPTKLNIFWRNQCKKLDQNAKFFGYDFRRLFGRMTDPDPMKRPSLEEIKGSIFCSKNIYDEEELTAIMKKKFENHNVV